jgi:hypothetical protein
VGETEEAPLHVHSRNIWYVVKNRLVVHMHLPKRTFLLVRWWSSHISAVSPSLLKPTCPHNPCAPPFFRCSCCHLPFPLLLRPYTARSMHLCASTMEQNCDVGLFFVDFCLYFCGFEFWSVTWRRRGQCDILILEFCYWGRQTNIL